VLTADVPLALTFDDGEGPLLAILDHLSGGPDTRHRTRTALGDHDAAVPPVPAEKAADYEGLDLSPYLQILDTLNPAHRLWGDGRWNKITLAHGCYWKKCSFCDVNLDYVGRYEPAAIPSLVDQMEEQIAQTGVRSFHLVDEAAPPKLLRDLALEILARGLSVSFWGNIRFEAAFTPDLCRLLAAAGMIAVTGGLEVAHPRLLERIRKGVTVDQVARCAQAFRDAGILVHAYLMYGFPTHTEQETLDSMELVRQLFAEGVLTSAFWHRFVLTEHAPIFQEQQAFGITVDPLPDGAFARNDRTHHDPLGGDHDRFDDVLPTALNAWMRGEGLTKPVHAWFEGAMPPTTEPAHRIRRALDQAAPPRTSRRLLWLGGTPLPGDDEVLLFTPRGSLPVYAPGEVGEWLVEVLSEAHPAGEPLHPADAQEAFPGEWSAFAPSWQQIRALGLLAL